MESDPGIKPFDDLVNSLSNKLFGMDSLKLLDMHFLFKNR